MRRSAQQLLACKGLDFLLWKTIRVFNFTEEEAHWYRNINTMVDSLLEEFGVSDSDAFYMAHYLLCFFSLQIEFWGSKPPELSVLKKYLEKYLNEFSVNLGKPDMVNSMSIVFHSVEVRGLDADKVYLMFLDLVCHVEEAAMEMPKSAHVDFLTSSYIVTDPYGAINFLSIVLSLELIHAPNKITGEFYPDYNILIKLLLIEEFNQLAKMQFEISLHTRMHSATSDNVHVPPYMTIFAHQFESKSAQKILLNVLDGKKPSFPVLSLIDEIRIDPYVNSDVLLYMIVFFLNEYDFKIFIDAKDKVYRIEKMINYLASYYIEFQKKDAPNEYHGKAIYTHNGFTGKDKEKETITKFLQGFFEQFGVKMTTKKLWYTHKEMHNNGFVESIIKSWEAYEKNAALLNYSWYEIQYQVNLMPQNNLT